VLFSFTNWQLFSEVQQNFSLSLPWRILLAARYNNCNYYEEKYFAKGFMVDGEIV